MWFERGDFLDEKTWRMKANEATLWHVRTKQAHLWNVTFLSNLDHSDRITRDKQAPEMYTYSISASNLTHRYFDFLSRYLYTSLIGFFYLLCVCVCVNTVCIIYHFINTITVPQRVLLSRDNQEKTDWAFRWFIRINFWRLLSCILHSKIYARISELVRKNFTVIEIAEQEEWAYAG